MERSKRESFNVAHETWRWPWDGMKDKRETWALSPLEPQCVHKEWVREQQQKQRLNYEDTTKTASRLRSRSRVLQVFSSRCTHCWVWSCACASCRQWSSCRCNRLLNFDLYPNSLCNFTLRKRVFWGVVFTHPVGYSRTAVSCKRSICHKIEWIRESLSSEDLPKDL